MQCFIIIVKPASLRRYRSGTAAGPRLTCPNILAPPLSVECSPVVRLSQHPQTLPATHYPGDGAHVLARQWEAGCWL